VQGVSNIIGVTELTTAAWLIAGVWSARASLLGGLACTATFLTTVSFLFYDSGSNRLDARIPSAWRYRAIFC